MPRATVSQETKRYDLVSCPDGYVELRTLSFHEMNTRADIAARMYQEEKVSTAKNRAQGRQNQDEVIRGYFELMNVASTEYEFRNCITNHNLEDENGNLIDFTRPMQAWRLDPKIGAEIARLIDSLNQEDEAELGPLPNALSLSSSEGETSQSPTLVES